MPGPRPQPTHLRLLRGNPSKRPINRNEPKPAIPPKPLAPPAFLDEYAAEEWRRIAPELHALGVLTRCDATVLAAYCVAYSEWRNATEVLNQMRENAGPNGTRAFVIKAKDDGHAPNPMVWMQRHAARDMVRYASEFGLSPAARSRIAAGVVPQEPRRFAGLLATGDEVA